MTGLLIFIGGGLGSVCRYGIGWMVRYWGLSFPVGTLIANVLASVALGSLAVFLIIKGDHSRLAALIGIGFCGGLSTFSSFSFETVQLFQQGYPVAAVANILLNLLLCLGAVWLIIRTTN